MNDSSIQIKYNCREGKPQQIFAKYRLQRHTNILHQNFKENFPVEFYKYHEIWIHLHNDILYWPYFICHDLILPHIL